MSVLEQTIACSAPNSAILQSKVAHTGLSGVFQQNLLFVRHGYEFLRAAD
jgi:hypothetical protein